MKFSVSVIASFIPVLMFCTPASALEKNEGIILKSVITQLSSNQSLEPWGNPDSGIVWVNDLTKTVHVDLYSDPCHRLLPPDSRFVGCLALAMPEMTVSFTAPLQEVVDGNCDRKFYRGSATEKFVTPGGEVNGKYDIEIVDNLKFGETCKSFFPMPPVSGFIKIRVDGEKEHELSFSAIPVQEDETGAK